MVNLEGSAKEGIPSNISKIYLFSYFWMALVILPIFVPYLIDLGLNMTQILKLQAFYGICVVILEIPTGYVSDILNRKWSLLIGTLISALGFTALPWVSEFWHLMAYEAFIAIGFTLISGTDLALFYDSLPEDAPREASSKGIAKIKSAHVFSEAAASLLSVGLISISMSAVIWGQVVVAWIPFLICLGIKEPLRHKMKTHSHLHNFRKVFRKIFLDEGILKIISINYVFWGLSTFFAVWTYQKFWLVEGISMTHFGWIWAIMHLAIGLAAQRVHAWEKKFGPVKLLWALSILPCAGYFLMGHLNSWWAVSICLFFSVGRALTSVLLSDAFNWRLENESRATANSIISMMFRLVFAVFAPAMGYSIDRWGIQDTFCILGSVFGLGIIIVMLPLIIQVKKLSLNEIPYESEV